MKLPCELVVCELLPTARRELAEELVKTHGYTQVRVAEMFGVTAAAISQYLKGLRGENPLISKSSYKRDFYAIIEESALRVHEGEDVVQVLCDICTFVKKVGMLDEIYRDMGEEAILPDCFECPRDNIVKIESE